MSDKAASFDAGGGAAIGFLSAGQFSGSAGSGASNSTVTSYKTAVDIMTDPLITNINLLAIPGIRESYLTDYAADRVRTYGFAMYVMDVPAYDDRTNRLYEGSTSRPSVEQTATQFESRAVDNSYAATYFPDVVINDNVNNRTVTVPASVAAYGALAFNDQVGYPWFAPAGFNRASLDFVRNVGVRLSQPERDRLQVARINPIATVPRLSFVIFGQKTLQVAHTALDRVNVRRLLLEVKRVVSSIAGTIVFEQNTPVVRQKFTTDASIQLGLIQSQSGIEAFQVIMNETNNTQEDVNLNRLRGRVIIVPTRSIEFIAVDFVITNTGVQFT
jgi:phage tail sheath protein FI